MIARVDYVILYVDDLDRSIAFYREMIGLQVKLQDHGYAELVTEGTRRDLWDLGAFPLDPIDPVRDPAPKTRSLRRAADLGTAWPGW